MPKERTKRPSPAMFQFRLDEPELSYSAEISSEPSYCRTDTLAVSFTAYCLAPESFEGRQSLVTFWGSDADDLTARRAIGSITANRNVVEASVYLRSEAVWALAALPRQVAPFVTLSVTDFFRGEGFVDLVAIEGSREFQLLDQ